MFLVKIDEEVTMRMLSVRDAKDLFSITESSRTHLRKWIPWVDEIKSINDTLSFIKQSFHIYAERGGLTAGVFYKKKLVGIIGFNQFDWKNKIGYMGYWLAEEHEGKGIMTRAVQSLIDYAFQEFGLNRIDIRAATENKKSRAIPERLGFTKEGCLRQAERLQGHYVDHIIYGILKSEWDMSSNRFT